MKIQRVQHCRSLREAPLDSVDMFLLSLAEDEIDLRELTEISPRNALECLRRILRLGELGLLDVRFANPDERLLAEGADEAAAQELLASANTLRPPPKRWHRGGSKPATQSPPVSLISPVSASATGIRARPTPLPRSRAAE